MIVAAMHDPNFEWNARSVGTKGVIVALTIDDPFALFFFLANDVAEDAAFAFFEPVVRGAQFVLDAPGYEDRGGNFRMGMSPLLAGQRALILENTDVFETRIFLQVGDPRCPNAKDAFDFFVAEL